MWLTKDTNLPEPIQISSEKEQGSYQFFNPQQWEKVRVSQEVSSSIDQHKLKRYQGSFVRASLSAVGTGLQSSELLMLELAKALDWSRPA